MRPRHLIVPGLILLSLLALPLLRADKSDAPAGATPVAEAPESSGWTSFVTPHALNARLGEENLVVIDVRKPEEYAAGHIPGAINLPGVRWRTPEAKAGQGQSQYLFRGADGTTPDVKRYEQLLSDAGLRREQSVVVYGNHAGKADGSVPAMILHWLGQAEVAFLDGVGLEQWQAAGLPVTTDPRTLPKAEYVARPIEGFVWNLDDVLGNLGNEQVVFYDTRSTKEYVGTDTKGNARGGHVPGAVLCNYEDFFASDADRRVLPAEQVRKQLAEKGITPDKKVVLYCQTATRVSLPVLALRDLGYKDVSIYDASMFEYANRTDTPLVTGEARHGAGDAKQAD